MLPGNESADEVLSEHAQSRLFDLHQARLLRSVRERCGMTRAEVASALGWSVKRLVRLENGGEVPTLDELIGLSRLYALEGRHRLDEIERRHRPAQSRGGTRR